MACLTFRVCIAQLEMGSDEYEEMEEEKEGEKEDDDKNQQIRMNFMKMTRRRDRQKSLMLSFEDIIVLTLFFFFLSKLTTYWTSLPCLRRKHLTIWTVSNVERCLRFGCLSWLGDTVVISRKT